MISLVIFDFDDTITDNRLYDFRAFQIPAKSLNIEIPSKKSITNMRKRGFLAKDIMLHHLKKNKNEVKLSDFLIARSNFINNEQSMHYLKLKNELRAVLQYIQRKKIKCVMCTTRKNKRDVRKFLINKKIDHYFKKTYFMENLGFKIDNLFLENRILIKHSLLKNILKDQKLNSTQVLYVGNSFEDLEAVKKMNISFIYYQNDYLEKYHNKEIKKISNMKDLKNELKVLVSG